MGSPSRGCWRVVVAAVLLLPACFGGGRALALEVWFTEAEGPVRQALEEAIRSFNEDHDDVTALLRVLPDGDYDEQVADAAANDRLPGVIWVDQASLAAARDHVRPVDELLAGTDLASTIPAAQSFVRQGDRMVAAPVWLELPVLVVDRVALTSGGEALPAGATRRWDIPTFAAVIAATAARRGPIGSAVSPVVSYPADERERTLVLTQLLAGGSPTGRVPSPGEIDAFVVAAGPFSEWLTLGLMGPADPAQPSPFSFSTTGGIPAAEARMGDEMAVVAVPGWSATSVADVGAWAITTVGSDEQAAVAVLLEFLLSARVTGPLVDASGHVPARRRDLDASSRYGVSPDVGTLRSLVHDGSVTPMPPPGVTGWRDLWSTLVPDLMGGSGLAVTLES